MKNKNKVEVVEVKEKGLLFVVMVAGLIWLRSGLGKLSAGDFVQTLGPTLEKFMSKNPYPWFVDFLKSFVMPMTSTWGVLIMGMELVAGISLFFGALAMLFVAKKSNNLHLILKLGLLFGLLLNVMFWFAAGWMSPSTDGLNLVMAAIEFVGLMILMKK